MSRIGIDLGGTRIKAGEVNPEGQLLQRISEPNESCDDYPRLLSDLTGIIQRLSVEASSTVEVVGVGAAGVIDVQWGRVLFSPNICSLIGQNLADDLSQRLKLPVLLDNDANCMAFGESMVGAAQGERYFITVTLGTGIGGALVSNGTLIRGYEGGGGELGHIPIDLAGPRCSCGASGCMEAFIGTEGIHRKLRERCPDANITSIKAAQELAEAGNPDAREVFAWVGRTLAIGLAGLVNVFGPRLIIIGGGVAAVGKYLFEPFELELRQRAFKQFVKNLEVRPAELGNWAGVVGAAWLDKLDPLTHGRY